MKKYYLGLDVGTNSVGIACTDENYNLLRTKGQDAWAVRLFEKAQTAVKRRTFRTSRRRLARRKQRIKWLQEVFAPYMEDETFFIRLNESAYYLEDKSTNSKFVLFADKNYTDENYYKDFKTVYHLRKALIEHKTKYDLRLYYLALHHIIKYRGHFLFEGKTMEDINDITKLFEDLNGVLRELYEEKVVTFDIEKVNGFKDLALSKIKGQDLKNKCYELFNIGKEDKEKKEIANWILGYAGSPKTAFGEEFSDFKGICLNDITDETFETLGKDYGDYFILLEKARAICSYIQFEKILGGNKHISDSMVAIYEKHKKDLSILKAFVLENLDKKEYDLFFKDKTQKTNYVNYSGHVKNGYAPKCKYEDFKKEVENLIKKVTTPKNVEVYNYIKEEVGNKTFLPKILNADGGRFPYQINEIELNAILNSMVIDYPETEEIAEKIKDIFKFKVPYYVGPLVKHGKNSWIVKKSNEKITPWNFDKVVDRAKSNEEFMRRMTNKCTYLHGEDVLPKCSITYQKFDVLNQINKLKINEVPVSMALKQDIFNDLFLKNKKVGEKNIKDYLVRKNLITVQEKADTVIGGYDKEIKASMSSYVTLKEYLGDFVDEHLEICEKIILWNTLNTDKQIVKNLILENYGNIQIIKENVERLKGLTFKDFGKLSKEFLCNLVGGYNEETGEVYTIMSELYNTNSNLNEILFDKKYNFENAIREYNGGSSDKTDIEMVEELYVSPSVKRGVYQSLKMVDEYVKAIGNTPEKIFVEVTRGNQNDKKQTDSRKKKLDLLYAQCKKDCADINELMEELNKKSDADLRSERLFLYYLQLGRCAYTGEKIDLGSLSSNTYDVDHIIPRSFTKDDSLENKVLVLRKKNEEKTNIYPLPSGFSNQQATWKMWHDKGLIGDKKYNNLTRIKPLTEEDFKGFVNAQKVITDQTAKAVVEILKEKYQDLGTKLVYSKAKYVSDFKNKNDLIKCRETNDLHHARDAYMNIVVGNVYDTKFTDKFFYIDKNNEQRIKAFDKLFYYNVEGAWDTESSLLTVKNTYQKSTMAVTRMSYISLGDFYKQTTILPKGKGKMPQLKGKGPLQDTTKYGGKMSGNYAYFVIVEENNKNKIKKSIIAIPTIVAKNEEKNKNSISEYLSNEVGLKNYKVVCNKLKKDSLIKINGYPFWLAGGGLLTDSRIVLHNAVEWHTTMKTDNYVNGLNTYFNFVLEDSNEDFSVKTNRFKDKKLVINKENNIELYNEIIKQLQQPIYIKSYDVLNAYKNLLNVLQSKYELFESLTVYKQAKQLLNLVEYLKAGSSIVDLTGLGGKPNSCYLRRSNDLTNVSFKIINSSPCGLTVKERII